MAAQKHHNFGMISDNFATLSLIPSREDDSPPRSTGVSDRFRSGGWATAPTEPRHALGSVGPDVLPFNWLNTVSGGPIIQYGADSRQQRRMTSA